MSDFVMGATVRLNNDFSGKMSSMVADTEKFKASAASADRALENLDKSLKGVNGNGLSKIGTSATQAATAAKGVVAPIDNIVQSTNRAQNAIQSFNRGWQTVKALPSTLSNIGNALKNNVADGFTSAKLQASILAATVKTLGKQKLTGMVDGIKEFTDTITEGKSGIKGFATGLKNIGKISIASTVNAVKSLTDKAKEFAKVKISNIANSLKGLKSSFTDGKTGASNLHTALKKVASVSLSALHSGISKIGSLAKSASDAVTNGLGKAIKATAKGASVAIGAGVTAVGALVTGSVKAFADFQQLTGGVETLFGAGGQSLEDYAAGIGKSVDAASSEYNKLMASQQAVFDNANKAYETAGLSANAYMETVTSFSASLLQSLGGDTQKAASVADQAIIDMADNANKMGTSMDMIQNAYQGFAKQNYTMLDNLKLGYGGTKEEMQRLLKDAGKLANTKFDISSYADVIEAIHVVQDNMGITGTTAKEASTTISGSAASMKAAWGNMLVSLTTGGKNFDASIDNLISTAKTFAGNLLPAITGALSGVGKLIDALAPMIAAKLPGLVSEILPPLVSAAGTMVASLVKALPGIVAALVPAITEAGAQIVKAFYEAFTGKEMSADAFEGVKSGIDSVINVAKTAVPVIAGLAVAFKAMSIAKTIATGIKSFATGLSSIAKSVTGGLAGKLTTVSTGMKTTGTAAASSGTKMSTAATSFMKMGVAVLAIGGGLALAGVGFALLAQSAIALAGAGGGAIAVMVGMVAAIALLAVGAAALGTALTAGAVGFIAFGGAVVLAGAGAVLFAAAVNLMTPPLLQLIPVIGQVVNTIVNSIGGILVTCIQTAGTAISTILQSIGDVFLKFGEGVSSIVSSIGGAISGVLDAVAGIFNSIGNAALNAGKGFELMANGLRTISAIPLTSLIKSLAAVGDGLSTMSKYATEVAAIGQGLQGVVTAVNSLTTTTTQATTSAMALVASLTMLRTLTGEAITVGAIDVTGFTASCSVLVAAVVAMFAQAQTAIDTGMSNISTSFNSLDISGITTKCTEITQAFTEGMANANTAVSEGITAITSTLNAVNLYSCGVNIMQGLNNGLASMRGTIIATAQSIANSVKATINSALDIHSPSRVLEESGEFSGEGFANGLLNLVNKVKENAKTLANTAIEPFSVQRAATDITPSGPVTGGGGKVLSGLKVIIENLNLNDVANKDPKQLVAEILKELYAQLGGDDELLGSVDMGVLL